MHKTIKVPANLGYYGGEVTAGTNDPNSHLNLYSTTYGENTTCIQFTPKTAKELRDLLLELYPLATPADEPVAKAEATVEEVPEEWAVSERTGFGGLKFKDKADAIRNAMKRAEGCPGKTIKVWNLAHIVRTETVTQTVTKVIG